MMGSELEMQSVYGKGSTFSFELLQTVVDPAPMGNLNDLYKKRLDQEDRYRESFTAPEAKVLVVDDNIMNQTVVRSLLKKTQVQIDVADDGIRCLEKCANRRYDLILMDHLMPNMDGIEAFRVLRADKNNLNYRTPVIILTANAVAGMKQQYLEEGFNGFLSKPVQAQLLEEALKQYLPSELVTLTQVEPDDDAAEQERQKTLRNAIEELGLTDLDLDDALQYSSGTVMDALENITGYLSDSEKNCGMLRTAYDRLDWKTYKIHAHALKSTSRVVGAVHMAYLAEQMEKAAGEGDTSYIVEHMAELLQEHEQLRSDLEKLLALPAVGEMLPKAVESEEPMDAYRAEAGIYLQQVQDYDVDFEGLRQFCSRYPEGEPLEEQRAALSQAAEDFDYEGIEQALREILELLN
jgi:CheY-like chemotaxis protein/HPt (histidine-containing phosphotransfer) domain-containing protein